MICSPLPQYAWEKVGVDLFNWKNKKFLMVVDYYSKYIEIAEMSKTVGVLVIAKLKGIFARHGIPSELTSDNGLLFNSNEFANFGKESVFRFRVWLPYYPDTNGEAEHAAQTAKHILSTSDPYLT